MTTTSDLIGETLLDRYTITGKLGTGGFAQVYQAHDRLRTCTVAVKLLKEAALTSPDAVARFQRDAALLKQLEHPHIVRVYEVGEYDGRPFIVMEYVEGQSLADRLRQHGPLPPDEALRIVQQVAAALSYAHHQGVIHRDLKPGNILLRGDGSAALTDFGIARVPGASLTANGQVLGTPEYMAPEQCQGQKADARSDIYALGVTLYQMLTGHPPFEADPHLSTEQRMLALLRMHVEEPPRPPRAVNPWLPADVDATLLRALAKEPEARYASVTQMMQAVETALRPAVAYTAETRPAVQPTPATGSSGRHQSVPGLPASQIRRDGELRGRYQPDAGGTRCRTLRSALTCTTSTRCCHDPTPSHRQSRARWATDARAAATHPD